MLFRNVRFSSFNKKFCCLRGNLELPLNFSRAIDLVLIVSSFFLIAIIIIVFYANLITAIIIRNESRKDGRLIQFFFLGTNGQSFKNFLNLFDPDNFSRFKGDKIQLQEKIKWKDYLGLTYQSFMFLFSFSWLFCAKRSLWRCLENLTVRICSFFGKIQFIERRVKEWFSQSIGSLERRMINLT